MARPGRIAVGLITVAFAALPAACKSKSTTPETGSLSLSVRVLDETGSPVGNAEVTLYTVDTKVVATVPTPSSGLVTFPGLAKGTYRIDVGKVFGQHLPNQITTELESDRTVDAKLIPGDDIIADCVTADGGNGCWDIPWPATNIRITGRYRSVSYPPPAVPSLGFEFIPGSRTGETMNMSDLTNDPVSFITQLIASDRVLGPANTFSFRFKNTWYPITCGNVVVTQCTTLLLTSNVTLTVRMSTPAPPGGGEVFRIATAAPISIPVHKK